MVMQAEPLDGVRPAPVSIEQAISRAVAEMRAAAAKADRTDYLGNWTAGDLRRGSDAGPDAFLAHGARG